MPKADKTTIHVVNLSFGKRQGIAAGEALPRNLNGAQNATPMRRTWDAPGIEERWTGFDYLAFGKDPSHTFAFALGFHCPLWLGVNGLSNFLGRDE